MAKWRRAKALDIPLWDTTVKSGLEAFAPTWAMVLGIKKGTLSEEAYRAQYIALMRESWVSHRSDWECLLSQPSLALACFCKPGHFCHRLILKEAVMKLCYQRNINVNYHGEIE